jgi:serine/threonine protein kinase
MNRSAALAGHRTSYSDRFALLVEELTEKLQAGEQIDMEAILQAHPEDAEQLRRLLPALLLLAEVSRSGERPLPGAARGEELGELGDFRIFREVGRGGMGIVYEAEQISLGRRIALKVLPFAATMDPRHLQRFQNEARAAASLDHPHIVPVYAVGCERGVYYYAMKFIDGQSLVALLAAQRPPQSSAPSAAAQSQPAETPASGTAVMIGQTTEPAPRDATYFRRAATWGTQAAEALEHAHAHGIVHRDIKPGNLMIDGQAQLWITDFGLARTITDPGLTMTGDVVGTLRYMSPEQALAKHGLVDHRTDVYALGATMYELLAGHPAVEGTDREEVLRRITFEEPPRLRSVDKAIPAELETIVRKAMEKDPADRYATAQELADDLRRWLEDRPIKARRPSWRQVAARWARRHRPVIGAAAALLAVSALALAVLLIQSEWHNQQLEAAAAREHQLADQAKQQRDVAREERRQARRAVDKMYVQVADRWLSRQPQMDKLQKEFMEEALRYYQVFAQEQGEDADSRYERAKAYQTVGHILMRDFNERDRAQQPYLEAIALLEKLLQDSPNESTYCHELGVTYMFLAATRASQHEEEKDYQRSADLLGNLVARFPTEAEYRFWLARSLCNSWNLLNESGRPKEAETACRRAAALLEDLTRTPTPEPKYLRPLAVAYINWGKTLRQGGRLPEAVKHYRNAIATYHKLTPNSTGLPEYQHHLPAFDWHNLGNTYRYLGKVLGQMGELEGASEAFAQALRIHEKIVTDFPKALHYWVAQFRDYRDQGTMFWMSRQVRQADEAYRHAEGIVERWATAYPEAMPDDLPRFLVMCPDPKHRNVHRGLELVTKRIDRLPEVASFWTTRAIAHYRIGDYPAALAAVTKATKLRRQGDCWDWFLLAMVHKQLGHPEQAVAWYNRAVEWTARNAPGDDELLRFRGEAKDLLGVKDRSATDK